MKESIPSSLLLEKLDQQHHLLKPVDARENIDFSKALQAVREQFSYTIQEHGDISTQEELATLCRKMSEALSGLFTHVIPKHLGHILDPMVQNALGQAINTARRRTRRDIEIEAGWKVFQDSQADIAVNALREFYKLKPLQVEKPGLSEAEKNAYRHLATLVNPALLRNLLAILHKDLFQDIFGDEADDISLKNYLGTTEHLTEPLFADLPPEIFIHPKVSWFRKILFNAMRDKLLPVFNSPKDGLKKVKMLIAADVETIKVVQNRQLTCEGDNVKKKKLMQENAWKRRFLAAVLKYFEDIENLPHPSRLKNSLGGREPFPSRHQQVAMFETAMLGNFFNGGEMGVGKTGAAIATFEYLREQRDEKNKPLAHKALILCPAGIVKVWKERLCNNDNGYFRHDQTPKVAIINGTPHERTYQWEAARNADYVVIGIEMSKESTDAISHEEWIHELGADFLVIDEVHNIRRASKKDTTDTQRIYRISQGKSVRYRVLLSGTPIPNNRKDIASQIRLLNACPDVRDASHPIDMFQEYLRRAPISKEDMQLLAEIDAENADEVQS
ncbi:MAG TPA: SNF2-related protein, partial [Candidatus Nanoarchaeia archaeon]|nr:SNF2-related protein [Candidatus Nanoarchaeia archaeon]